MEFLRVQRRISPWQGRAPAPEDRRGGLPSCSKPLPGLRYQSPGQHGELVLVAMRRPGQTAECRASLTSLLAEHAGSSARLLGSLLPVSAALLLSHRLEVGLEREIQEAVLRSSVQIVALGFLLKILFQSDNPWMSLAGFAAMVTTAGYTAGDRAKQVPGSHAIAWTSLGLAAGACVGLSVLLRVFPWQPRHLIPAAGYVVGNSMSMVGGALNRLHRDMEVRRGHIEASLALGATAEQAVRLHVRRAVRQSLAPMIDSLKTTGIVSLPGSMAGMLMAGNAPFDALAMQLHVSYMQLGAACLASLISATLAWRVLFRTD